MSGTQSTGKNSRDLSFDLCIWGGGLSGYTLAAAFAAIGRRILIVDTDPATVDEINSGTWQRCALNGDRLEQSRYRRNISATVDTNGACSETRVHIVCVPTARDDRAWDGALIDVTNKLTSMPRDGEPLLLIICSTVAPNWIDTIVHAAFRNAGWRNGIDYGVASAPRRDVFHDSSYCLSNISMIVGADSPRAEETTKAIFGAIYERVYVAPDAKHASLVKVVENLHRHSALEITNRLSAALPDYDMAEVFRLAGTKWNMEEYRPSLGIGGNCVPVAISYMLDTVSDDRWLFESIGRNDSVLRDRLVRALIEGSPFREIGILGLAYAPGLKVHSLSPALSIVTALRAAGIGVRVNDPLYDHEEVEAIVGVPRMDFPSGVRECDCVIITTAHKEYVCLSTQELAYHLPSGVVVIDNCGAWRGRRFPGGVTYLEVGSRPYFAEIARWMERAERRPPQRSIASGSK